MAETLIPTSLVPGLVTVEGPDGEIQNVFPIDAKDLIASGDYKLVNNGAAEAARLNVNPLRSGRYSGNADLVVAEVTGIAGIVVEAPDEKTAEKLIKAGDTADARAGEGGPISDRQAAERSAQVPDSAKAEKVTTPAAKAPAPAPAAKADDKK